MLEKWLLETQRKFPDIKIDRYVVMPNHIHVIFVLRGGADLRGGHIGPPLHGVVGWFKTMTTNEYIRGVKAGIYQPFYGRVWQRSYHEHIIRDRDEYGKIRRYIDENPFKWTEDKFYK
jgi:REP element-mobilizing transposase RayT